MSDRSTGKCNHTNKFIHFIEYNMRKFFFEESCTKSYGENSSRLFMKKTKIEHISGLTF